MMPDGRLSLRQVRRAAQSSITTANQHADLINTQVLPGMRALHVELLQIRHKLDQTILRLDAHLSRTFWQRLRYLVTGR